MPVSIDTKLTLYNNALRRLGSRELASLSENREPRRVLDGIWGSANEIVLALLERGDWNFAIRTVEGIYSSTVQPSFGFRYAFEKPVDFRRMSSISADEYFTIPLVASEYVDEAGYFFSDLQQVFIRYVSDDGDYGLNSAGWTQAFKDYIECDLAWKACERLTNNIGKRDRIEMDRQKAMKAASSVDAINEGVKFLPSGSWIRSRGGRGRTGGGYR